MSLTLRTLCTERDNQFRITLRAGGNGFRNAVTWVHVVEDDYVIPFLHGSELAVTTGIKTEADPGWLSGLVRELHGRRAAGLIVNTGKYILDIPEDVLAFCDEAEFPLLTMPWEIHVTEMLQTFCTRIIQERQDNERFDRALTDAVLGRGDEAAWREVLGRHFDPDGQFVVIVLRAGPPDGESGEREGAEYAFINRLRRFKTIHGRASSAKFGLLPMDDCQLLTVNNLDRSMMPELLSVITESYRNADRAGNLFIGVGTEVTGLASLSRSCQRAEAAMRMAACRGETCVRFEDMGFYRILFSVKDEEILRSYAAELLGPLEERDRGREGLELLRAYIENDRSLERTAEALYLHRNTVNYRLQKLKALLDSPLKTAEDLFPYQVALAIRDMERRDGGQRPAKA